MGSPQVGNKGVVRFRSLMQADVFPGRKLRFDSRHVTGDYRCEQVAYVGDTHGADWYCEGEAKAL